MTPKFSGSGTSFAKTIAPSSHERDRVGVAVLEDVVAEADDELLAAGEVARHADDLRDPAGLDLHLVGEVEVEEQLVARRATRTRPLPSRSMNWPACCWPVTSSTSRTPARCSSCSG